MITLLVSLSLWTGATFTAGPVETVQTGFKFTEGPLWLRDQGLIFSDVPGDTIYHADKRVFRNPSGQSNGITLDPQGRVVNVEHKGRRVVRAEADGSLTVIADRYQGKRLNSPNDVVVRSDGTVYFTDPPFALPKRLQDPAAELDFAGVFMVTPKGELRVLARDFAMPNGLALSPDEKTLYVDDTELGLIRAFDVAPDGVCSNERKFCDVPEPDGMKVDTQGNIWCTGGVLWVFSPKGETLQKVEFPQEPSNCTFGDADYKTLYVTARTGVYKVRVTVPGIAPGPKK